MKALVLKEYKKFSYEDVPAPEPKPGEVLVAVKACGICGSDVHGMDGSTGRRRPPIIMGHEAAGVIADIGKGVSGWTPGDRVTFDSTIYCGECDFCKRGLIILYRLPNGLPFEHAALAEPFSIALHALRRTTLSTEDKAVVVGAGMIGLALVQALRQAGCPQIICVDIAAERLELAGRLGASHLLNSAKENAREAIMRLTDGRGADASFEAVGITVTVDLALSCLRKGGAAVLVGNVAPKIEFPLQVAVTRELTISGSCASKGDYPDCLAGLASGQLQAEPLISATAPLAEGASWFERLYRKEPGLIKVVLKP